MTESWQRGRRRFLGAVERMTAAYREAVPALKPQLLMALGRCISRQRVVVLDVNPPPPLPPFRYPPHNLPLWSASSVMQCDQYEYHNCHAQFTLREYYLYCEVILAIGSCEKMSANSSVISSDRC